MVFGIKKNARDKTKPFFVEPLKPKKVTVEQAPASTKLEVNWKYECNGRYRYVISYRKGDETEPPTFISNSTNTNHVSLSFKIE